MVGTSLTAPDGSGFALLEAAELLRAGRVDTLLVAGEIGPSTMRRVADLALAYHCEVLAVMPTEVLDVLEQAPGSAQTWRLAVRDHFRWALKRGYAVSGVHRNTTADRTFYILSL